MRPLRIEIEGLRSYRRKQEVDLDKRGLVAIIGDTGAGKSSILEALVYALYNATTWDQRGVKQLLADGARKVAVVLDFSADDKEWRVTRSTGAQPIHELRCLSHPNDPLGRVDGETAVNAAIVKLVGLGYDAFRSAVVLPQGRFQQLLTSSPKDRTAILKGILRVDDLEVVRELGSGALERLRPELRHRIEERAQYFPDPAGRATAAGLERNRWEAKIKTLKATTDKVAIEENVVKTAHDGAARLDGLVRGVGDAVTGAATKLAKLTTVDAEIVQLVTEVDRRIASAAASEQAALNMLDAAAVTGVGLAEVGAVVGILERLGSDVSTLAIRQVEIARLREQQLSLEAQLAGVPARVAELAIAELAASGAVTKQDADSLAARDALTVARGLLTDYRGAVSETVANAAAKAAAVNASQETANRLDEARKAVESARTEAATAQQARDALQRHNAAAHAAQGVSAGDPCPVCARPLPKGFTMPPIKGQDEALQFVASARAACSLAERNEALAADATQRAAAAVVEAEAKERQAHDSRDALAAAVTSATGVTLLADDDAVTLARLHTAVNAADVAATAARDAHRKVSSDLAVARKDLEQRQRDVDAAVQATSKAAADAEELSDRIDVACGKVPEPYRPSRPLTETGCATARAAADERFQELREIEEARRAAASDRSRAEKDRDALNTRRREEVESPAAATAQSLAALHLRLVEAAPDPGAVPPFQTNEAAISDRAIWAQALEDSAAKVMEALAAKADVARSQQQGARTALKAILDDAGFTTVNELSEARMNAEAERLAAAKVENEARDQVPLADALDKRIRPAQGLVSELEQLVSLLSDAKFIRFVVDQKQLALLGVASAIFGEMTGERYGFAQDFQVIDRLSGQPRDAKTLSGGETFLASLALALGLVEIAGRSGGRLEALFLDEGFGALDTASLDEAMTALEHVTGSDRLVAVISHLKAVSERIENVLYVKRDPADRSSEARWIGPTEKDRLVEEEMEQGLLT